MALAPSRYELLDRIAVGGMAEVFRAKAFGAHGFEKTLAIKRILPELARDPEFEERFIAEAKLAVGLSHANVVQVLDFGRFAGSLFIAMELVSGLDLAALLKYYSDRGERIPIPAAFQISIEIIRGLSFAHQNEVVHRDVSPSNILLSKAGEVKIADFGIAMAMREGGDSDEGRIMGKWRYMSPEQTKGRKLSERSDLFSAAVVIHEIFSGSKLFPGSESSDIIENIHNMPIPRLCELRPGVPEALDEVLDKALERSIDKRQDSGADMLRALTEASYKSSIVATSIDVADAVGEAHSAGVEGASVKPQAGMDDLIRQQLAGGGSPPVDRRTAVAVDIGHASTQVQGELGDGGTMVRSGVDQQGVTIWKLDKETVAAIPSAKRSREDSEGDDPTGSDSHAEKEGREEPIGPGRYNEDSPESPGLRRGVLYSAIGFSSLIAVMIYFVGSGPNKRSAQVEPLAFDAATSEPLPHTEILEISSLPPGATIYLDGERLQSLTPARVPVPVDQPIRTRLVLDGYQDDEHTHMLKTGSGLSYQPTLVAFRSTLVVNTTPKGATVLLDGQDLGVTQLVRSDLRPGKARALELRLKDHKTVAMEIDLLRDETTTVEKNLRSTLVFGDIRIIVAGSWAEVSENGKKLGNTSKKIRLRVGNHRLRLHNPISGKTKIVSVQAVADSIKTYRFSL